MFPSSKPAKLISLTLTKLYLNSLRLDLALSNFLRQDKAVR